MAKVTKTISLPYSEIEDLIVEYLIENKDIPRDVKLDSFDVVPELDKDGQVQISVAYTTDDSEDVVPQE